jgi:hypothetical protein
MREPRKKAADCVQDSSVRVHLLELLVCFYTGATPEPSAFVISQEFFDSSLFDLMEVQFSTRYALTPTASIPTI